MNANNKQTVVLDNNNNDNYDNYDNYNNEDIINLTTKKIHNINVKIIKKLYLTKEQTSVLLKNLKHYRYIDEVSNLKYCSIIKCIAINDVSKPFVCRTSILCDIIIAENNIFLLCKNFIGTHFQLSLSENLVFQKLTSQELIILHTLDYLDK